MTMFFTSNRMILRHFKRQFFLKHKQNGNVVHFCTKEDPRKFFVGGNMKMNGSKEDIERIAASLSKECFGDRVDVVLAPPSTYLEFTRERLPKAISLAAQNCYKKTHGAFTGEISPPMALEMGATWVILGHSERRTIFNECDELIVEKIQACLDSKLNVIACLGENLEERESGKTTQVVIEQLKHIICQVNNWKKVVIAYEPVWAIGTGKVATPDQAQQVHCSIRHFIKKKVCSSAASIARIIYGGSVTGDNAEKLAKEVDIDGFLVGGATLKEDFIKIIHANKVKACDGWTCQFGGTKP